MIARRDRLISVIGPTFGLLLGCVGFYLLSSIRDTSQTIYGPRFWPLMITSLLIVINIISIVMGLAGRRSIDTDIEADGLFKKATTGDVLAIIVLLLYPLAVSISGFLFGSFIFLLVFVPALGYRHLASMVSMAVLFSVGVTAFFTKVAYMPLPKGIPIFSDATIAIMRALHLL